MQLEKNQRYRTRGGNVVRVFDVLRDKVYAAYGDGNPMTDMRICYYPDGQVVPGKSNDWDIIGSAEPELMFSFKRPSPYHSVTASETKLKQIIASARSGPLYCMEDQQLLADAAERMVEQAKHIPKLKLKVVSYKPIRDQIADLLTDVGLNPDRFLTPRPEDSAFTTETKPMCTPPAKPSKADADRAASDLLMLMRDDLGITTEVSATLFRLWLVERWDKVAKLAHKIHGSA